MCLRLVDRLTRRVLYCATNLSGNFVFSLHQTTRIVTGHYVPEPNIVWQSSEKRNPLTNEHRNACDNESLNKSSSEKSLNSYSAIHVNMLDAASIKLRCNVRRFAR